MKKIATIGFFDGVHKGHCFLFEHLREIAAQRGLQPLIVTFDTHPRAILQSDYMPQLLTTLEERKALLSAFGEVVVLPFTQVQPLTAEDFLKQLKSRYEVDVLLMGYDHRFGSDRLKHPQEYRRIGEQHGIEVITMSEFTEGEWHVSSTEIRQALENANIALATELLGRHYQLTGTVVHGNGIGRTIGFPTANIQPDDDCKIIPGAGVYEVQISNIESHILPALCNIGTNPTVGNAERTIEVYIPGFEGNLYGRQLTLSFVRFLREEHKFASIESLRRQISEDLSSLNNKRY